MSWQHRVWRDSAGGLSIRETYYDAEKNVTGWDIEPNAPYGFAYDGGGDDEAKLSLGWFLAKMQGAMCFPILDEVEMAKKLDDQLIEDIVTGLQDGVDFLNGDTTKGKITKVANPKKTKTKKEKLKKK